MEMVKSDWVAIRKSPPWAIDSWGLGTVVFMPCLFSLEIICSSTLCPLECNSFTKALYFLFEGCLIYELFSGSKLAKTEELRNTVGIPKVLFSSLSFLEYMLCSSISGCVYIWILLCFFIFMD